MSDNRGTQATLQNLQPDPSRFSDLISFGQDIELKERQQKLAEKAQADADEIARRNLKIKENKDFDDRYGIDDSAILKTGFNSYDELMLPYAQSIKDEMWEVKKALNKDPDNMRLKQKFSNLSNSINTVKKSNESFTGLLQKYATLQEQGGISGVHEDKWLDLLQKYKDYKVIPTIDKKTGLTSMVYEDANGDRVAINLQDMIDGNIPIYSKTDSAKLAGGIADQLGVRKVDSNTGRFIKTEIKFDDVKDSARLLAESSLKTDEELADILNQSNGSTRESWDTSTKEGRAERDRDVKIASDWLLEQVKASYDTQSTLKERSYPPSSGGQKSTAGERKERRQVVDRNQTIANAQNGDVEQLVNRPAWDVDDNGKRIEVIIDDAVVTDDKLILSLSNGNTREVDIKRKSALNEIYNKATGIKVDTDMLDKLQDASPTKQGDLFEQSEVPLDDSDVDFVTLEVIGKEEAIAQSELTPYLEDLGMSVEQKAIGRNRLQITAPNGNQITIKTSQSGTEAQKEAKKLKDFIKSNGGVKKAFVKKEIKLSDKADAL